MKRAVKTQSKKSACIKVTFNYITDKLVNGDVIGSIDLLLHIDEVENCYKTDLLLLKTRFNFFEKDKRAGIVNTQTLYYERNDIISSILGIISLMEKRPTNYINSA